MPYRDAVGFVGKAKDGEQDDLLEFTEGWRGSHLNYIVVSWPAALSSADQNESVALNRASRGFRMAVGFSHVAPLFAYRNV